MQEQFMQKGDAALAATGLGVGTGSIAAGTLMKIATVAQALSMIGGCIITMVTLIFLLHRYIRWVKSGKVGKEG